MTEPGTIRLRFPRLAYNALSMFGAVVALVTAAVMAVALLVSASRAESNPYLGVLVYMALPPVLFLGLLLIPIGMWRRKRLIARTGETPPRLPYVDFNKPTHRNAFLVFVVGTVAFVLLSLVGGYQAYHFTESIAFCGRTCHTVMKPEYVAYQGSPHARVACVSCHVGPGAGWYAKSKLSGLYQVWATLRDIYPRPIETPIRSLRPAQQTCEQCHWPQKLHGNQARRFDHFRYDDANTPWQYVLLLKTGGGDPGLGKLAGGIHWHMNIAARVEYIPRDATRQDIPWIRVTDHQTGEVRVYQDRDQPLAAEVVARTQPRVMDCVDCHNRPSHNYHAPDRLIDEALAAGRIDRTLPAIKQAAVRSIRADVPTEAEGRDRIAREILAFYRERHPEVLADRAAAVDQAVAATQAVFSANIFPEMKVSWKVYPDNIGHQMFPGCMRCHDGKHVSDAGQAIGRDCRSCHTIVSQGSGDELQMATSPEGLEFQHPVDIDDEWKETGCYECHDGTQP